MQRVSCCEKNVICYRALVGHRLRKNNCLCLLFCLFMSKCTTSFNFMNCVYAIENSGKFKTFFHADFIWYDAFNSNSLKQMHNNWVDTAYN